jgi:hypothetical protein
MAGHVDIHAHTAYLGLAHWDSATSDVTELWKDGAARIQGLAEAAPWGHDSAGTAFQAAYTKDGGPERMIHDGDKIMKDVDTLGVKVRTAVNRTRATDKEQAQAIESI